MRYFVDFITGNTKENINTPDHGFETLKITLGEMLWKMYFKLKL